MGELLRCKTCGSMLTPRGELGVSCPRCLLSLASEPESQDEIGLQSFETDVDILAQPGAHGQDD